MKPHYKIIIVAENANDLNAKAQELAREFKSNSTTKAFKRMEDAEDTVKETKSEDVVFPVYGSGDSVAVIHPPQAIPNEQSEDEAEVATTHSTGDHQDTDSRGIKWDARIHLSNKKQKADGTWMYKRNLDENLKVKVEAELLSGVLNTPPAPLANVTITPPVVPQTDVHPAVAARNARLTAVPSAPAQPVAAAMPAPNFTQHPNETGYNFESFKQNLPAIIAGLLRKNIQGFDQGYIQALADHFGVANLWEVVKMDQHCHVLFEEFKRQGFVKGI